MRARTVVASMALCLVAMAWALEHFALPRGLVARLTDAELTHLIAHTILYGSLAAAIGAWWFPRASLDASKRERAKRALAAALCFALIAGAQELTQSLSRGRLPNQEEFFDLAVDGSAATLGLIVWTHFDRRRRWHVARALGIVLHPAFVGPAGVFAVTWSVFRDTRRALAWTTLSSLAVLPVAALWIVGLRRGWFSDRDLSQRSERPLFLVGALAAAGGFALFAHAAQAPSVVCAFTLAGFVATALFTVATLAGVKVSGHVAVPVGVLAVLQATSYRGLWPFALMALAVSWARVREGRHTRREVLAGWCIAGASGLLASA
ncbi:MAG: hypothetical protein U0326_43420 [Polyangiales bacterium]